MNKPSSGTWLALIFGVTLTAEAVAWLYGAPPEPIVIRLLLLSWLFARLLKGSRFARYTLAVLYFLGGVLAAISAIRMQSGVAFAILFSLFSLAAAAFFVRSDMLRAMTSTAAVQRR